MKPLSGLGIVGDSPDMSRDRPWNQAHFGSTRFGSVRSSPTGVLLDSRLGSVRFDSIAMSGLEPKF